MTIGTHEHVSSETVRRLCCDANLIRVVTDGGSEILDLGRTVRTAPQIPQGPGGT